MVQFTSRPLKASTLSTQKWAAAFSVRDLWSFPSPSATLQEDALSYKHSLKVHGWHGYCSDIQVVKVNCNRPMRLSVELQFISHNSSKLQQLTILHQ